MCNSSTAANHSRCLVMSHNALRDGNNNKKTVFSEWCHIQMTDSSGTLDTECRSPNAEHQLAKGQFLQGCSSPTPSPMGHFFQAVVA